MVDVLLDGVSKRFGDIWAVRNLNLRVEEGEAVVLLGPTGSGKTTVLRLIAGLEQPTSGDILLAGRAGDPAPHKRNVSMLFAQNRLYPRMTARANIAFPLSVRSVPEPERTNRVEAEAAALGIQRLLDRMPGTLSAGQANLVHLAKAMVRAPGLFLVDEPLNAVDARARRDLRRELRKIQSGYGSTAIYATHDQDDAMTLGDRLVLLSDGVVEQSGPPTVLHDRPDNLFVAGFIGSPEMSVLSGSMTSGRVSVGELTLSGPPGSTGKVLVGVRPHRWTLGPSGLAAVVTETEDLGADRYVSLMAGPDRFQMRWAGPLPSPGEVVRVTPESYHLFDPDTGLSLYHS